VKEADMKALRETLMMLDRCWGQKPDKVANIILTEPGLAKPHRAKVAIASDLGLNIKCAN
jgi:hypothetical protein